MSFMTSISIHDMQIEMELVTAHCPYGFFWCRFNCSCKVVVQVQGRGSTLIECIGEAKSRKNAAEEDAAEGALCYLKHIGCQ